MSFVKELVRVVADVEDCNVELNSKTKSDEKEVPDSYSQIESVTLAPVVLQQHGHLTAECRETPYNCQRTLRLEQQMNMVQITIYIYIENQ